ncbi:MAG: polyprenyl synthetase family protein [Phycisphaerae bacterium]|jgi:geranylgeranyl pyrophosphate synthase|nr:polyprenyl synthetase family protein [Phycisphaerae bacterium]
MHDSTDKSMQDAGPDAEARSVPARRALRNVLRQAADDFADERGLTAPLSLCQLRRYADELIAQTQQDPEHRDFLAILIHNATWRATVAAIPYDKRLLLLPQCLKHSTDCEGHLDDIGLVCSRCGRCDIAELQNEAEQLGYAMLVAEGSPVVMSLIESGQVQAVIGVSCLSMLEKVFPYMEAGAVPGLAIPLLGEGCCDTKVDAAWTHEAILCSSRSESARQDLQSLRDTVDFWFSAEALADRIGTPTDQTEQIALDWLAGSGKRWRPFLAAGVYQAISGQSTDQLPEGLKHSAVAIECFHKASLIHDDIEDHDSTRYGQPTMHETHGVEIAINAGDLLIGEGYRLLAEADASDLQRVRMMQVASTGHRTLCLGQGAELIWARRPGALSPEQVIEIFAQKTAPAFDVALQIGAIAAGGDDALSRVLHDFSRALGIAYQIHDDIDDHLTASDSPGDGHMCPNILDALSNADDTPPLQAATKLLEQYKTAAIEHLDSLTSSDLKSLLRRMVGKIFCDFEIMSCCDDDPSRNADSRETLGESAG